VALRPQDRGRGLTSLNEARQTRRRAIVLGRVRVREVATRFWLFTFAGLVLFSIAYYRYAEGELAKRRGEVLAQQRAVVAAFGTAPFELKEKLEPWVLALASGEVTARVDSSVSLSAIAEGPGIYVRLRQSNATDRASVRNAAARSLHDGFTSCLFIGRSGDPKQGVECKATSQCGPGELCNDWGVCSPPSQPYNLRLLYQGLKVVEPEWVSKLEATTDDLQVLALELDVQDAAKHEIPAAAELVRRSKYFTVVLDELPASGLPEATADAADLRETPEERLQATDHFVRVGIWDIERSQQLLALRVEAAARYVAVGRGVAKDPRIARAQQRQANNCAVGTQVREVLAARHLDGLGTAEEQGTPGSELIAGE
jgi:hypothetical protein